MSGQYGEGSERLVGHLQLMMNWVQEDIEKLKDIRKTDLDRFGNITRQVNVSKPVRMEVRSGGWNQRIIIKEF